VPVLLFFIFIAAVVLFLLALGCALSSLEEVRSGTRRCRIPRKAHYRMKTRRRRVRCRLQG
jgi:hypothetical protein